LEHNRALGIELNQPFWPSPFVFDIAEAVPLFLTNVLDANASKQLETAGVGTIGLAEQYQWRKQSRVFLPIASPAG